MIENIESMVIKKTNKYVYLSNNTYMTHAEFHKYKNDIRNEYTKLHNTEFKNSIQEILILSDSLTNLKKTKEDLENKILYTETDIMMLEDTTTLDDYKKWWEQASDMNRKLKNKLTSLARKIYKDYFPINNTEVDIKFIIQQSNNENYRLCYDPLQFVDNYHSALNDIFDDLGWNTISGGWLRIIDNEVILFGASSDYGVYNNDIAIECATILFKGRTINSYPNKWQKEFDELHTN